MYRITAQQFINEMGAAPGWELIRNSDGEYQLGVKVEKDGEVVQTYLGPNPREMEFMELKNFNYRLLAITMSLKLDKDMDMSVSRLNTDDFLRKIAAALEWTTVVREGFVELLVLFANGTMEKWLSEPYQTSIEEASFVGMIESASLNSLE